MEEDVVGLVPLVPGVERRAGVPEGVEVVSRVVHCGNAGSETLAMCWRAFKFWIREVLSKFDGVDSFFSGWNRQHWLHDQGWGVACEGLGNGRTPLVIVSKPSSLIAKSGLRRRVRSACNRLGIAGIIFIRRLYNLLWFVTWMKSCNGTNFSTNWINFYINGTDFEYTTTFLNTHLIFNTQLHFITQLIFNTQLHFITQLHFNTF